MINYKTAQNVIDIEIKALKLLKKSIDQDSFNSAIDILFKTQGKIIISGIGKSGHIASKISSTLSSVGSSSFFIHPSEANHGDLGMITKKDSLILISNSGETLELTNLILHCNKLKIPIISITSEIKSTLSKKSQITLIIPKNIEACPLELAPTSSTTCTLVLGDAIAMTLLQKKKFTSKDFFELHPGGSLGQMLLKVSDLMKTDNLMPLVGSEKKVGEAILEMSSKGQGCVGVILKNQLVGIITDGDLRRHMSKNLLQKKVSMVMTPNPKTLPPDTLVSEALVLMKKQSITNYFITKKKKKPLGVIHLHDILK